MESIAQESISASSDFLFITSFEQVSIKFSRSSNFQVFSNLDSIILSIGQSQIHLIAFNQNLILLSSI
jgi:hypothetical protein